MNAVVAGTQITAAAWNEILAQQSFKLIYEGTAIDSKTGAGTSENNVFTNYYAIRFTATGVSTMARATLEVAADGSGQDLTVQVLDSNFAINGSNEGTVLKTITIPKEFLPASAGTVYIPLNLTGLTPGNNYWLKVGKVGDVTNHFHLIGEASQDGAHPCYYRAGTSGAWSANNALHFAVYTGNTGDLIHGIYGTNLQETYIYSGEDVDKVYRYCPPAGATAGGIRDIIDLTFDGDCLTDGAVT